MSPIFAESRRSSGGSNVCLLWKPSRPRRTTSTSCFRRLLAARRSAREAENAALKKKKERLPRRLSDGRDVYNPYVELSVFVAEHRNALTRDATLASELHQKTLAVCAWLRSFLPQIEIPGILLEQDPVTLQRANKKLRAV